MQRSLPLRQCVTSRSTILNYEGNVLHVQRLDSHLINHRLDSRPINSHISRTEADPLPHTPRANPRPGARDHLLPVGEELPGVVGVVVGEVVVGVPVVAAGEPGLPAAVEVIVGRVVRVVHVVLGVHPCAAPAARRRAPEPQEQRGSGGSERRPPRGGSNRGRVARRPRGLGKRRGRARRAEEGLE